MGDEVGILMLEQLKGIRGELAGLKGNGGSGDAGSGGGDAGSGGSAGSNLADSVTQHGITFQFDEPSRVGQFANGDYWVVGPVNLVSITGL